MRYVQHESSGKGHKLFYPGPNGETLEYLMPADHQPTVVAIYDGIQEQVAAVRAGVAKGLVVTGKDQGQIAISEADFVGRLFKNWDEIVQAVETRWESGVVTVEAMLAKLAKAKLPKPVSIRPRKTFREDDGNQIDLGRLQEGQPYWLGVQRRPVGGPKVISLLCQIGANGWMQPEQLLWRGAAALCVAQKLEDAGYRTEIIAYDYGRNALVGKHCAQATWIKRSQDKLNIPSLVNAVSGWYFRTVNFASLCIVPGEKAGEGFGSEAVIPDEVLVHLTRGLVTPWIVHNVWDEKAALAKIEELLNRLNAQASGRVAVMP